MKKSRDNTSISSKHREHYVSHVMTDLLRRGYSVVRGGRSASGAECEARDGAFVPPLTQLRKSKIKLLASFF